MFALNRRVAASLVTGLILATAACSSTKAQDDALDLSAVDGTTEGGTGSLSPLDPTGSDASAGDVGAADQVADGSDGSTLASPSDAASGSSAGSDANGASPVGGGSGAPGGTAPPPAAAPQASNQPLLVGAYGLGSAGGNIGAQGAALGDPVAFSEAMAKWVNEHGGVAGRPIKLVQASSDPTSTTPLDQQDQAACAKFTEDNKVVAIISIVTTTPTFDDCTAKRRVIYIANSITQPDTSYTLQHGLRFSSSPAADRMAVTLASELMRNGYLRDTGIKLGIASANHPWYKRSSAAFKDALARLGGPPVLEEFYGCMGCGSDQATQEAQNAALRFRAAGITHVVVPDGSSAGGTFLNQANATGYFPRLGLTSSNLLSLIAINVPNPRGLAGAVAIGFMPTLDTDGNPRHGAPPLSEREKLCDRIMDSHPGATRNNRLAEEQAQFTCDGFWFLKEVGDRAGAVDRQTFARTAEGIGDAYAPTLTFTAFFGPGRHDGAQTYRPAAFDEGCSCFVYTGGEIPFTPLPGQPR